nr:sialate O-acetylesterase [uncultured Clostridium sp.]
MKNELGARIMYPGLTREKQIEMNQEYSQTFVIGPYHPWRPEGVFEMMLKKIVPYTLRGVIWYQGESDEKHPKIYGKVFSALIKCWRDLWGEKLPFLFVQLAPFEGWFQENGNNFPRLREEQEWVAKHVENVWMVSSSDCGMQWDIHPKRKRPLGERLAWSALGHVYNKKIACDPPEFLEAKRKEGFIRIKFKYASGLNIEGNKINALQIIDKDKKIYRDISGMIEDDCLLFTDIWNDSITVAFANDPYYKVNLYNQCHNPAKPFIVIVD